MGLVGAHILLDIPRTCHSWHPVWRGSEGFKECPRNTSCEIDAMSIMLWKKTGHSELSPGFLTPQAIDGQGNVAAYTYDAVGNLLSITRNTGGVGAPTITGLTPNTGNAGASVSVSITGTNLTGAALATDNPGILVRNVLTTPTSLTATFQISFAARTGATAVTIQ